MTSVWRASDARAYSRHPGLDPGSRAAERYRVTHLSSINPIKWLEARPKAHFLARLALTLVIILVAQQLLKLAPRGIQAWLTLATGVFCIGYGLFQTTSRMRDLEWRNPDRNTLTGLPYILGGAFLLLLVFADHDLAFNLPE